MEKRGQCPEIEVVERYVRGELPVEAVGEFQAHLEVCGVCSIVVERLKDFDLVASCTEREPDWTKMEARLAEECGRTVREVSPRPGGKARWRVNWNWHQVLGYGAAIVLAYPAWLGIVRAPSPAKAPTGVADSVAPASGSIILDLNTVRGEQGPPVVTNRSSEPTVVVSFFVPASAGTRYAATILDAANHPVAELGEIRSFDQRGNYCVVLVPGKLALGRYQLRVRAVDRAEARESTFEFVRQ